MQRSTIARRPRPPHDPLAAPAVDRRLEAIGAMLSDGAAACDAGRWTNADAARGMLAAAADCYALAFGYGAALEVPAGAALPPHARATIARACGDDARHTAPRRRSRPLKLAPRNRAAGRSFLI